MSDRLVTIAAFQDPMAAELAKNYLESEGIPAVLMDETTVATDWMLSAAIGGVKLQVARIHVERAEMLLTQIQQAETLAEPAPAIPETAIASQEIAEDLKAEQEDKAEINQHTDKLFRSAVFGLILWPLQLYAIYMMLALLGTEGKVSPNRRWKVWASVLLNMPIMALVLTPLFFAINSCGSEPEGPDNPVWRRRRLDEAAISVRMPHTPYYRKGEHAGLNTHDWTAYAHGRTYFVAYEPGAAPVKNVEAALAELVRQRIGPNARLLKDAPLEFDGLPARECVILRQDRHERARLLARGDSLITIAMSGNEKDIASDEAEDFFRSLRVR